MSRLDCVFCKIASGELPHAVVIDRDEALAFMDQRQPSGGHVLVIPRRHVENIFELDEALGGRVIALLSEVARAVRQALSPAGVSIWQSNGPGAHQEVPHIHFHVMPRFTGDGLLRVYPSLISPTPLKELERQASAIRSAIPIG
jgi:histidine triad (HIT) family protein